VSEERLTALEELTAHQALTIEELSGEIARQWQVIRALERRLEALGEQIVANEEGSPAANVKPPHW